MLAYSYSLAGMFNVTFNSEEPVLRYGFDRLPRIPGVIASCYPFARAYVWLYRLGALFLSPVSCDFTRFFVVAFRAATFLANPANLLSRDAAAEER